MVLYFQVFFIFCLILFTSQTTRQDNNNTLVYLSSHALKSPQDCALPICPLSSRFIFKNKMKQTRRGIISVPAAKPRAQPDPKATTATIVLQSRLIRPFAHFRPVPAIGRSTPRCKFFLISFRILLLWFFTASPEERKSEREENIRWCSPATHGCPGCPGCPPPAPVSSRCVIPSIQFAPPFLYAEYIQQRKHFSNSRGTFLGVAVRSPARCAGFWSCKKSIPLSQIPSGRPILKPPSIRTESENTTTVQQRKMTRGARGPVESFFE